MQPQYIALRQELARGYTTALEVGMSEAEAESALLEAIHSVELARLNPATLRSAIISAIVQKHSKT